MNIKKAEIRNFKNIDFQSLDLNGRHAIIQGPNQSGKTSLIDALFHKIPSKPLRDNQTNGSIKVDTELFDIEFKFSEKNNKGTLNIFDKTDGAKLNSPKTVLKELFGIMDFDIESFLSKSDSKRIDFIKDLMNIDWSDLDEKRKEYYDDRAFHKKTAENTEAKIDGREYVQGLTEVDISSIESKLESAASTNQKVSDIENGISARREKVVHLEDSIKKMSEELLKVKEDISNGEKWIESHPKVSTESISSELSEARERNEMFRKNEEVKILRDEAISNWNKYEDLDKSIKDIDQTKKDEIKSSGLKVSGLEFDGEKFLLDGHPFESDQINTARKIIAGLEIQLQLMGEMKIARFDASLLDSKSMDEVYAWAENNGVQLFMELVDRSGDVMQIDIV